MEWLSGTADSIGILGALFALLAWLQSRRVRQHLEREQQRQNRKVIVVLQHGGERLELPVELRRAEVTRAEILGRLGMIRSGQRFDLAYLNNADFLRQINAIIDGSGDALVTIPCTKEEFEQFHR